MSPETRQLLALIGAKARELHRVATEFESRMRGHPTELPPVRPAPAGEVAGERENGLVAVSAALASLAGAAVRAEARGQADVAPAPMPGPPASSAARRPRVLTVPLGAYPDRQEFQVGRMLVWVLRPAGCPLDRQALALAAEQMFPTIEASAARVLALAVARSRVELPAFWRAHERAGTSGQQLDIWGIGIDPMNGTVEYDVHENLDFLPPAPPSGLPGVLDAGELPRFPRDRFYRVRVGPSGNFEACTVVLPEGLHEGVHEGSPPDHSTR